MSDEPLPQDGPKPDTKKVWQPGKKPTNLELEERVRFAEVLICKRHTRTEIHVLMEKRYGVEWRTADRYVARARRNLAKIIEKDRAKHLEEAILLYQSIIRSGAKPIEQIKAQERLDKLLGLEAPTRTQLSGPEGKPIQMEDTTPEKPLSKERLRELIALGTNVAVAHTNGHTGNGHSTSNGHRTNGAGELGS